MRKLKERYEETALMKQANTRAFSAKTGEYGDDAMGLTRGLLDTDDFVAATGSSLKKQSSSSNNKKVRMANTKATRKRDAQLKAAADRHHYQNSASGLASSISFTPVQGMELVNPEANKKRVEEANLKWFKNEGFQSTVPKK